MPANLLDGLTVEKNDITYLGHDLKRPECILAEKYGTVWSADERGGVDKIAPGRCTRIHSATVCFRRRD